MGKLTSKKCENQNTLRKISAGESCRKRKRHSSPTITCPHAKRLRQEEEQRRMRTLRTSVSASLMKEDTPPPRTGETYQNGSSGTIASPAASIVSSTSEPGRAVASCSKSIPPSSSPKNDCKDDASERSHDSGLGLESGPDPNSADVDGSGDTNPAELCKTKEDDDNVAVDKTIARLMKSPIMTQLPEDSKAVAVLHVLQVSVSSKVPSIAYVVEWEQPAIGNSKGKKRRKLPLYASIFPDAFLKVPAYQQLLIQFYQENLILPEDDEIEKY